MRRPRASRASCRTPLVLLLASASGLRVPSPPLHHTHASAASSRAPQPCLNWQGDGCSDTPAFLSDPFRYIEDNPELFNEDFRRMAAFQQLLNSDQFHTLMGDLSKTLDETTRGERSIREKAGRADELAKIILTADQETLSTLADDSIFEEKRALFEALAALPSGSYGMKAIHETMGNVIDWSHSGPQARFDRDLQRVTAKVAEANAALAEFDAEYSTLFLSVRKVMQLARAGVGEDVGVKNAAREKLEKDFCSDHM